MNTSLSAKDLFRSACIALVLTLAFAVVAAHAQDTALPAPASEVSPTPTPSAAVSTSVAPRPEEKAPAPVAAPTVAPAAETASQASPPAPEVAPIVPEQKSELRRLDVPENEVRPGRTNSRRRSPVTTSIRSRSGSERVTFGRDSYLGKDEKADTVVSIFGSSTSDGEVGDAVVSIFGDTRVTGPVGDSAVAVLGNVYVNSKVSGEVVAVLGSVELGPKAEVFGEVVAVGGSVTRDPGSVTHQGVQNVGFSLGRVSNFEALRNWFRECFLYARPLAVAPSLGWAWTIALACLALYVLIALLFREGVERCVTTFEQRPGGSIIAVLLTLLLAPLATILLAITGVGLIVVPFIAVGVLVATLVGKSVILGWLGRRFSRGLALPLAVLIGGLVVLGLYVIPVVGAITYLLIKSLGLGVVIYTLVLNARPEKPVTAAVTPGATPAVAQVPVVPVAPLAPFSAPPSEGFTSGANGPAAPLPPVTPSVPVIPLAAVDEGFRTTPLTAEPPLVEPALGFQSTPQPQSAPASFRLAPMAPSVPVIPAVTLPRAGFWIRIGALLIDLILVGMVLGPLTHGSMVMPGLAAYGAVMWKLKGTTIGGIICGLKVVRLDDRELDWPTAIVRALGCFLSMAVAGLGFLWVIFDDQRQSWHDKIAGTVVVKMPKGTSLV
jgi:uncharacterized RDD family membrane protein YckC